MTSVVYLQGCSLAPSVALSELMTVAWRKVLLRFAVWLLTLQVLVRILRLSPVGWWTCGTFLLCLCKPIARVFLIAIAFHLEFSLIAVHAREMLIPYIYNATRQAFDDGISLLRPMYYEFPQNPEAYLADGTGVLTLFLIAFVDWF